MNKKHTVGKQITVGQLIEKCTVMKIFKAMIMYIGVRTPILSHTDLACNTSYRFAASRTVFPRVSPHLAWDRLRLLAHVYNSVASILMTKNPADMTSHEPKVALTYGDRHT